MADVNNLWEFWAWRPTISFLLKLRARFLAQSQGIAASCQLGRTE